MPRKAYKDPEKILVARTYKVSQDQIKNLNKASVKSKQSVSALVRQGIDLATGPILKEGNYFVIGSKKC